MKKNILICLGFSLCLILLIVASFYDLQISMFAYDKNNFYAKFFDIFGEFPLYALFPVSLTIIYSYFKKANDLKLTIVATLCIIISFCTCSICIQRFFGSIAPIYVVFLISIIITMLLAKCFDNVSLTILQKLYKFAIFTFVYCLCILLVNQSIKFIWGRCRFCTMVELNDYSLFSNWWEIQWFTGNKSFYSGHVTSAMSLLSLVVLGKVLNIEKRKLNAIYVLVALFVVMISISRIIYGAHFLSDIVCAIIICGIIYMITYKSFLKYLSKQE